MNAIVPRQASSIPAHLALPEMPARLVAHLAAVSAYAEARARFAAATPEERETMHVGLAPQAPDLTAAERSECDRALSHLDSLAQPITEAALAAWLAPVNAAVRNPQDKPAFLARVRAMAELLGDLPFSAFTVEARRRLGGDFFPSAGEIRTAVALEVRALRERAKAMREALRPAAQPAQEAEPARQPRTMEEIMAVKAKAAAFKAEMASRVQPAAREAVKPGHLPSHHLLAAWEDAARRNVPGAALRFAALRKQYHMDEVTA